MIVVAIVLVVAGLFAAWGISSLFARRNPDPLRFVKPCPTCSALVQSENMDAHLLWHERAT